MTKIEKKLEYYKSLPYKRRVYPMLDDDGTKYFLAKIIDLPDCIIDGDSPVEAMLNLDSAFDEYILSRIELKYPIATPTMIITSSKGRKKKFEAVIIKNYKKSLINSNDWKAKFQPTVSTASELMVA